MSSLLSKLRAAKDAFSRDGIDGVLLGLQWWLRVRRENRNIAQWLETHGHPLSSAERETILERITHLPRSPMISVVMPVYDVDERWLRRAIESVIDQVYPHWELCVADDASPSPHVRRVLDEYAAKDDRIKVTFREENGHISAASNSALELATGDYIGLLDHDDELTADALFRVAAAINENPNARMFYSDEDVIGESGQRHSPKLKPAWSRDLFYSVNYVTHFAVYESSVLRKIGGFRIGFEGSQDYDLALRVLEEIGDDAILHIPHILYHWRAIGGSVALSGDEKPYAHERARRAIREHFERIGVSAEVSESVENFHRVRYDRRATFEMISVDPAEPGTLAERLNTAAAVADSDVLVFFDSGLTHGGADVLAELVGFAMQPGIGAVGGRVVARDRVVEEAGLVLDTRLAPHAAHQGFPRDASGNLFRNWLVSNFSAISVSCFVIRRELFEEMGRFDSSLEWFDVDLCLRLRERGKRIVMVPDVELERFRDTATRKLTAEGLAQLSRRWPAYMERDPFCNPNLKRDGSFELF